MAKQKTIEEYEADLKVLQNQRKSLDRRIMRCIKAIDRIRADKDVEFIRCIPFEIPEKITSEQWKYLLHHDRTTTTTHLNATNKILMSFGIYGGGYWNTTNQISLSIGDLTDIAQLAKLWSLIKDYYKPNNPSGEYVQINLSLEKDEIEMFRYLQIKPDETARISKYDDWEPLEKTLNKIKKLQAKY